MKTPPPTKRADITRLIDAFHAAKTPKQQLAILDSLEAVPRELRKWFKHRGVIMDPAYQRVFVNYLVGRDLFIKAEREYWKHHDPGDIPDQGSRAEAFGPTNRAIERASKTRAPARTRGRAIDYTAARTQLEPYAEKGGPGVRWKNEALRMLGAIALREGRYREAIRYLESATNFQHDGLLASAYLALGDREAAKQALYTDPRRGPVYSDRGFIAELDGKRDLAIAAYVEALDAPLSTWRAYAAFRLKRLNVTPAMIRRLKAEREAARNAGKIVVASVEDFYVKFDEIAEALRNHQKNTAPRKPMTEAEIAKLRLPTLRRGKSPSVAVPRSMATVLRYDRDFRLFADAAPLLTPCKPVDIEKLVRADLRIKLPARKPVWNDDPKLPACIGLSSPGDQRVFLYMGTPDEDGEFPVVRYDDQPEIWISAASLVHHILDAAEAVVQCTIDFAKRLERAKSRNRYREALSKHVDVEALLDRD